MGMNVREESTQKRHDESMAMGERFLESWEKDHKLREKELELSILRDKRERRFFWVAIFSLLVSAGSLYVAALVLHVSCLPQ